MTTLSARLHIEARGDLQADAPHSQTVGHTLENATGGRGWRNGTGSGEVDRIFLESNTFSSGQNKTYNLLAAGALTDVFGQAIDADELKGLMVKCTSGEIAVDGGGAGGLDLFEHNQHGIALASGMSFAVDLGAAGLDVTTNSSFRVAENASAAASYTVWLIVAQ